MGAGGGPCCTHRRRGLHSFLAGAAPQPAAVQGTCLEPSWRGSAHAASIRQHIWFRMIISEESSVCLFACGCRFSGDLPVSNAPSSLALSLPPPPPPLPLLS